MATRTTISPPELAFPGHSPVCPSLKSTVSLSQVPGEGQETATCNILGDLAVVLGLGTEARGQLLVCALLMRTATRHSGGDLQPDEALGVRSSGRAPGTWVGASILSFSFSFSPSSHHL